MRRTSAAALLLLWAVPAVVLAQTPGATVLEAARLEAARRFVEQAGNPNVAPEARDAVLNGVLVNELEYLTLLGKQGTLVRVLQDLEERRSDKQLGATSSSAGTTTLVSKGTVPKVLALAVENGALTQAQSGTVVTFRTNFVGALRALAGAGYLQLTPREFRTEPAMTVLSRISASVSFDTSRGANGALTGDRQQLSQWTARIELINRRDQNGPSALEKWDQTLTTHLQRLGVAAIDVATVAPKDAVLMQWAADTTTAVTVALAATTGRSDGERVQALVAVLEEREAFFPPGEQLASATRAALLRFDMSAATFETQRQRLLDQVMKGALASLEFTNDRPVAGPSTTNVRVVGEIGGVVDITGNGSVTFFDTRPDGAGGHVRDYELSGQLDVPLGSPATTGGFVLSFAGKWMEQREDTIDVAGVPVPDTKGTWRVLQAKLLIPMKGSGAKIPLSLTLANRTELIKEKRVLRANVGVTYDLDMLFARFKPL